MVNATREILYLIKQRIAVLERGVVGETPNLAARLHAQNQGAEVAVLPEPLNVRLGIASGLVVVGDLRNLGPDEDVRRPRLMPITWAD
jgi:class 3 adenylate cyclase